MDLSQCNEKVHSEINSNLDNKFIYILIQFESFLNNFQFKCNKKNIFLFLLRQSYLYLKSRSQKNYSIVCDEKKVKTQIYSELQKQIAKKTSVSNILQINFSFSFIFNNRKIIQNHQSVKFEHTILVTVEYLVNQFQVSYMFIYISVNLIWNANWVTYICNMYKGLVYRQSSLQNLYNVMYCIRIG